VKIKIEIVKKRNKKNKILIGKKNLWQRQIMLHAKPISPGI
jgi:hypothetical protein